MRVLVLSSTFPNSTQPNRGVFVRERIARLARRCDVVVVAPIPWFPLNRWIRSDRAGAARVDDQDGLTVYHPRFFSLPRYGKCLDGFFYALSLVPFLVRLRRRFAFEIIDAHFAFPDGVAATLIGRLWRRPVVITLRGSIARLSTYRLHRPQIRWALRRADRVTAVADYLRRIAIGIGVPGERVRVIPNGVDLGSFAPGDRTQARRACDLPADRPILLTVAAVYAWKGQHLVVEALPGLLERFPRLLYVMVGGARPEEPEYVSALRRRVAELGLEDHVRFVGPQPHAELGRWFNAADVSVLATRSEGCPNVLLESLACGVPVVSTEVGGVPEIVRSGVDGILAPYGDLAALRAAVRTALERSWDREALVRRAREFDWADAVEQALEEIHHALKGAQ
ncbi:MAG TPA: glycosyltransferase family 4 protein [Methylomirabilota bacterium]|nr:glycosyltransferase family 4 protein [Methylomirabilota bacterium]